MKLPRVAGHRSFAPSVLAYGLLAVFFVGERLLRRGVEAQTLETTSDDQGTTRLIGISYAAALNAGWLAPLLSNRGWGRLSDARVQVFGLSLMVLGLVIKAWAIRTLGSFYTRTLRTKSDQPVIDSGPYQLVRHPGYLGALLLWTGFGLAVRNWLATLGILLAVDLAYARRIRSEEAMLATQLGEPYAAYQRRTWQLLPGVR
jgi:protein-S-isoprenylcysteine O-methyltransferase Ste14